MTQPKGLGPLSTRPPGDEMLPPYMGGALRMLLLPPPCTHTRLLSASSSSSPSSSPSSPSLSPPSSSSMLLSGWGGCAVTTSWTSSSLALTTSGRGEGEATVSRGQGCLAVMSQTWGPRTTPPWDVAVSGGLGQPGASEPTVKGRWRRVLSAAADSLPGAWRWKRGGRGGRRWQQGLATPVPSVWLPAHLGAPGR